MEHNEEEKLPCIDCITLPICRQYVNDKSCIFMFHFSRLVRMAKKCDLLDKFLGGVANIPLYNVNHFEAKFRWAMEHLHVGKDTTLTERLNLYWSKIDAPHFEDQQPKTDIITYKKVYRNDPEDT